MIRLRFVIWSTIFTLFLSSLIFDLPKAEAASYNRNNLCNDSAFVNKNALNLNGIQNFLKAKGSFLKSYSTGGRTAAKIIYDAAQEYGVSPYTIMATIQKEEGLIYGTYAKSPIQIRLDWAMGYGYTDSVILQKYKGFASQIDNGTWQLRRNYDYWATNGSVWNVGRTMTIDGVSVKFANKCTSSLYRYTPHLGGNYNFWYYFNLWSGNQSVAYGATYVNRVPASPATVQPGQTFTATVTYKNTGTATWSNTGTGAVKVGTIGPANRTSAFFAGNRINMTQATVQPGASATFTATFKAPQTVGTYIEEFQPITGSTWFGGGMRWVFYVKGEPVAPVEVAPPAPNYTGYSATTYRQGGLATHQYVLKASSSVTTWVYLKNTGTKTWSKTGSYAITLKSSNASYSGGRTTLPMATTSVRPGRYGLFYVRLTSPASPGNYVATFTPAINGTAIGNPFSWTIVVK